jgi:hypothetical protein
MSGRHVQSATGGRARIWLAGLAVALTALLVAALAGPADASSTTLKAQLSLSGLASADNPLGGSVIGVHPGDKVSFSAAGTPTAGLDKLGLGGLVGGILNLGADFQIKADFSGLPGGADNTILSGTTTKTFAFPDKGSYSFTWTAQKVTLLGIVPIALDGNQLAQAGIKLNASNEYVGKVVAATNPPSGGLSVQLPGVKVAPSLPVVGQLPTLSIPGVNLPTVGVTVPDLNPGSTAPNGASGGGKTTGKNSTTTGTATPALSFQPPGVSVPQLVVPGAGGGGSNGGSGGGGGGFRLGVTGGGSDGQLAVGGTGSGGGANGSGGTASGAQGSGGTKTVDLASSASSPSGELPVVLAILAVITLAMVAGIYARLYLLGRKPTSS